MSKLWGVNGVNGAASQPEDIVLDPEFRELRGVFQGFECNIPKKNVIAVQIQC